MDESFGVRLQYPDEIIREAAAMFVVYGNVKRTAEQLSIPVSTLNGWVHSDWWDGLIEKVRHEKQSELDGRLSLVIDKAFDAILDRLDQGDYKHTKDGIVRVPVSARDATVIAGIAFDKRQILRNLPTSIRGDDSRLNALADKLRAFAPMNVIEGESDSNKPDSNS